MAEVDEDDEVGEEEEAAGDADWIKAGGGPVGEVDRCMCGPLGFEPSPSCEPVSSSKADLKPDVDLDPPISSTSCIPIKEPPAVSAVTGGGGG